ncbi:hypothetical protein QA648_28360 (plasmid) [Rhizobium sp. CB3171]|uniref:hypothetical protein n=1 Tax=Rhizobium sp. CB3171 TaxID=3039157 RepID=UPI0024B1D326|nr:hypothetical protein [Rhizobium sp. CB3171]WFU04548.1 hypothetical protein QA648_27605 [Rhizobium sp. CB3171]WFU04682.1 hypothetical protein QA648_28360 [Rhizobium sp. CB3171]
MSTMRESFKDRVEAKRAKDAEDYLAPRLKELEALAPVLRARGLEMDVYDISNCTVIRFIDRHQGRESPVTVGFPTRTAARSKEARWARAEMDIWKARPIYFGDNDWLCLENSGDSLRIELEGLSLQSIIDGLAEKIVETPIPENVPQQCRSENVEFAKAYKIIKEVTSTKFGAHIAAQRDANGVESFAFRDREKRQYRMEFGKTAKLYVDDMEVGEAPVRSTWEIGALIAKHYGLEYSPSLKRRF